MFKISGKQEFGAVWKNGVCVAKFVKGVATTNDPAVADVLKADGYTVEGEQDAIPVDPAPVGDNSTEDTPTAPVEPVAPAEPEVPATVEGEQDKPRRKRGEK